MSKKQSSIDSLIKQICGEHTEAWEEQIAQAKAIHKDEIMDARTNGMWYVKQKWGEIRTNKQYYTDEFKEE